MTANQRLEGLLSGKKSSFDRPMPITDTSSPPPVPPSADKPRLSALSATANNAHDHHNMDHDHSTNESQVSLGLSISPPIQKPTVLPEEAETGAGFKQVELPSSNTRLETPPKDK